MITLPISPLPPAPSILIPLPRWISTSGLWSSGGTHSLTTRGWFTPASVSGQGNSQESINLNRDLNQDPLSRRLTPTFL